MGLNSHKMWSAHGTKRNTQTRILQIRGKLEVNRKILYAQNITALNIILINTLVSVHIIKI